jgi:hypothetical protein
VLAEPAGMWQLLTIVRLGTPDDEEGGEPQWQ